MRFIPWMLTFKNKSYFCYKALYEFHKLMIKYSDENLSHSPMRIFPGYVLTRIYSIP